MGMRNRCGALVHEERCRKATSVRVLAFKGRWSFAVYRKDPDFGPLRSEHNRRHTTMAETLTADPPSANSPETMQNAVTLMDAFRFVESGWKRHRSSALAAGCIVAALTAAYIFLAPKKYRSDAQLYVRLGRESVTLDPTATTGETFNVSTSREHEINSVVEILSSTGNIDAVVERLSPEVVLETAPLVMDHSVAEETPQTVTAKKVALHEVMFEQTRPETPAHELARTALQKQISIEAVRRSNSVNASCVAGSPELAQELLTSYLNVAIERHMRASRSSGSFEFFRTQSQAVEEQYNELANELADLKSEVGVSSLEERRKTLQEQLSKIEADLATTEAQLSEAEGTVTGLVGLLETLPKTSVATTTGIPEDALGQAERRRNLLAIEEQELLSKYTPNHPEVVALREQMRLADQMLKSSDSRKQSLEGTNPTYIQIETLLATERAKVAGLTEKRNAYEAERIKANKRLTDLNSREAAIASLEERVKVLRTTAGDYATKLEQARIDQAIESEHLSNIAISQPATFQPKAVSPKRRVAGVVGGAFAIAAAIATLLIREFLDRQRGLVPVRLPGLSG